MNNTSLVEISTLLTPLLLGVIAFFIRSLYERFDNLEKEVKQSLIDGATFNQRVVQLEKEVEEIRKMILELITKHGTI